MNLKMTAFKVFGHELKFKGIIDAISPLLGAIVILFVGYILTALLSKIITRAMTKANLDVSLIKFIKKVIKISCYIIVIISALSSLGVSTTGIVAAFSAAGVAIALALKDSLSNIAGGIIPLVAPRFSTGDYIKESEYEGTVISVDLMHTTIRTFDNLQVAVPNGLLMNNQIVNYSREATRRIDLTFPISYENDPQIAIDAALKAANAHPLVLKDPEPFARISQYDASSVNIALRVWTESNNFHPVRFDLLENVKKEFDLNNIKIPFNQLDVHISKDDDK